jgi:ADP-ribose pyrophosphatase
MNLQNSFRVQAAKNLHDLEPNSQLVYHGRRIDLFNCKLPDPSGTIHQRDLIIHPGAAVILPLLEDDSLLMIRNERFSVGETLWELPAGTLEPNESPIETAYREIIEETGYQAAEMIPLTAFYSTPGFCNEVMYAFVAQNLTFVGQKLDVDEKIDVEVVSWTRVLEMLRLGEIKDAKSIASLLYYHTFRH